MGILALLKLRLICSVAALLQVWGCYAFSGFQTARLLEPGRQTVVPSYSRQAYFDNGNADDLWAALEVQYRRGLRRNVEVGARFSRISLEDGYQFAAVDAKVGLVPGRVAVALPVGTFFGQGLDVVESFQAHPTLLINEPLGPGGDLVFGFKGILLLEDPAENLYGINVGLRSRRGGGAIHPEISAFVNPGEDGVFIQWGIGFSFGGEE